MSAFPDIPEEQKAWIRHEETVSSQVRLFNMLAQDEGKQFAFDWFRDGAGYFLSARTWVPFLEPSRAFILYACWEQANLRGNRVTLEKLSQTEATVRMHVAYFELYEHTAHLKQQIGFDDYRRIFDTVWQNRAHQAGWDLRLTCKGAECIFDFSRPVATQRSGP